MLIWHGRTATISASNLRVFEIPSRISVFLLNVSCCSEPFVRFVTIHTRASATSVVAQPASPEAQRLPSVEARSYQGTAKSPGSAVLWEGSLAIRQLRCTSREVGSSPKLCLSFYKKKTKVLGMDFSEVGAEFGSCGHRWRGKHTEEMQNRPEVQSLVVAGGLGGPLLKTVHCIVKFNEPVTVTVTVTSQPTSSWPPALCSPSSLSVSLTVALYRPL
eukprot:COSAG03_NODE_11_length_23018_cov_29.686461_13_plen_217_part_00